MRLEAALLSSKTEVTITDRVLDNHFKNSRRDLGGIDNVAQRMTKWKQSGRGNVFTVAAVMAF
jgi:hypothetical protein